MKFRRKTKGNDLVEEMIEMRTIDGQIIAKFPTLVVNQLRHMVTRLKYTNDLPDQISIVSSVQGEGITYITWALASIIANDLQATVCTVELNWWHPSNQFSSVNTHIAAVLDSEITLDEAILKTKDPHFDFILAGFLEPKKRAIYARRDDLKVLIEQLKERYDFVILDVPAILSTSASIPLASLSDHCCMVIRQGVTQIDTVQMALEDISHLSVLGVILNQVDVKTPSFVLGMIPQN
jgi:Mrp family chromosome partitioning ATPase